VALDGSCSCFAPGVVSLLPTSAAGYETGAEPSGSRSDETVSIRQLAPGTREIRSSLDGVEVSILTHDEGDCTKAGFTATYDIDASVDAVVELKYSVTSNCSVDYDGTELVSQQEFRAREGLKGPAPVTETVPMTATSSLPDGDPGEMAVAAACGTWVGNYIHTSQTVQDVINIDVAKYRLHTDRKWNGCGTYIGNRFGDGSTSMPWNHYTGDSYVSGSVCSQASPCGSAYYRRKGNFHTDFLWCNFTSQNFSLYNRNTTYQDGAKAGQWTQSQVCPLTHMATAIWANTNPNG
jgi:hypothetical protein